MAKEIEVRFLEIDKEKLIKNLEKLGSEKIYDSLFKIRAFYVNDEDDRDFIRIRNEGDKITLAHKINKVNSIESEEFEIEVNDFESAYQFVKSLGYTEKVYLEKRRIRYFFDECFIDIDFWPEIPIYVEIEGESEECIRRVSKKLGFDYSKAHKGNAFDVFRIYGIEPKDYKVLTFDKVELFNK